ncbi:glycosyltransferase family 2 protein [bacterium]|nr:glycosyltransferase family 2 protein [bacterium]
MPFESIVINILFLFSVSVIWIMILYQLVLTLYGHRHRRAMEKRLTEIDMPDASLPPVSILIPARNEEVVIARTLDKILALDYPADHMEVIVINDGSTDRTQAILDAYRKKDSRVVPLQLPMAQTGRGKAHALNAGFAITKHDYIAVYDADNNPEASSLKTLVRELKAESKVAAVIGKFRTLNWKRNILTRFINIETLSFQWILQAGRYRAFQVSILPGTNFVIRKEVITACGGWDEAAITEDAELSVRIYQMDWKIKFVPHAVTWEQEPEKLDVWIRQRTRWVRGNNYVIRKFVKPALGLRNRFLFLEFLYLFILYYLLLGAIVTSHLLFILCGFGILNVDVPGPYMAVWILAFILYLMEVVLVLSYEDEDKPLNVLIAAIMYFTYCQMWIYVVFRGFYLDLAKKRVGIWDKTERHNQDDLPGQDGDSP